MCVCSVTQSSPTLCDPMVCSPPGSSVQGISQARTLEWVAMFSSRGSSDPGIEPTSPALAGGFLTSELPGKLQAILLVNSLFLKWKWSEVPQSYLALCDPTDTRVLHPWDFLGKSTGVGCLFLLQGTSRPRDQTQVSRIVDRSFTIWATREVSTLFLKKKTKKNNPKKLAKSCNLP